jgi:hypothetical protein
MHDLGIIAISDFVSLMIGFGIGYASREIVSRKRHARMYQRWGYSERPDVR